MTCYKYINTNHHYKQDIKHFHHTQKTDLCLLPISSHPQTHWSASHQKSILNFKAILQQRLWEGEPSEVWGNTLREERDWRRKEKATVKWGWSFMLDEDWVRTNLWLYQCRGHSLTWQKQFLWGSWEGGLGETVIGEDEKKKNGA